MIITYNGKQIVQASSIYPLYGCFGKKQWVYNFSLHDVHPAESNSVFYLCGYWLGSLVNSIDLHERLENL